MGTHLARPYMGNGGDRGAAAPIISARSLVKTFGKFNALDGLDLTVEAGQIHGFLGPNGAGKSTTIRAILGQISLTGGELTVFGRDPKRDVVPIHKCLAQVPGDTVLWGNLTGGECLDILGRFHGSENLQRRAELIEKFNLDPTKKTRAYSKGNRQKVALISALALDVDLFIFDEPTSGLDPLMEEVFQDAVRDRQRTGATVLLSSHILDEVEALCSHVTIIKEGKTVSTGSMEGLRRSTTTTVVANLNAELPGLAEMAGVTDLSQVFHGDVWEVSFKVSRTGLAKAVGVVAAANPISLVVRPPSLDELFLEHYETGN